MRTWKILWKFYEKNFPTLIDFYMFSVQWVFVNSVNAWIMNTVRVSRDFPRYMILNIHCHQWRCRYFERWRNSLHLRIRILMMATRTKVSGIMIHSKTLWFRESFYKLEIVEVVNMLHQRAQKRDDYRVIFFFGFRFKVRFILFLCESCSIAFSNFWMLE